MGYRRLTQMMIDENIVAVSGSAVYRVLRRAGLSKQLKDNTEMMRKHLFIVNPVSFRAGMDMNAFISLVKDQFENVIKAEPVPKRLNE
ncbi:MAG: hypothetical protein LBC60_10840 [Spirochaetaceae bacterium]|jgi:hypothetical protein|nr:hypothetical protein [Spirochaetaceae bacterium]